MTLKAMHDGVVPPWVPAAPSPMHQQPPVSQQHKYGKQINSLVSQPSELVPFKKEHARFCRV